MTVGRALAKVQSERLLAFSNKQWGTEETPSSDTRMELFKNFGSEEMS